MSASPADAATPAAANPSLLHGTVPDGVHCPSCSTHFRAAPSRSAPVLYTCGHSVCGECDEAAQACEVPVCDVCKVVAGPVGLNGVLGEYSEAVFVGAAPLQSIACADCNALGDADVDFATVKCET